MKTLLQYLPGKLFVSVCTRFWCFNVGSYEIVTALSQQGMVAITGTTILVFHLKLIVAEWSICHNVRQ